MPERTYEPSFVEICTKVNNAKDKPAKIRVLREYQTESLEMFLKGALDPNVERMLPEGNIPYISNQAPEGTEHTTKHKETHKHTLRTAPAHTIESWQIVNIAEAIRSIKNEI